MGFTFIEKLDVKLTNHIFCNNANTADYLRRNTKLQAISSANLQINLTSKLGIRKVMVFSKIIFAFYRAIYK